MASVTTWRRLEPRNRDEALTSLAARVADPLWMVARQWQIGELTGADAASPVLARLAVDRTPITAWVSESGGDWLPYEPGQPVEQLVDAVTPAIGLADRARAGRHFLRLLGAVRMSRYAEDFRSAFPVPAFSAEEAARSDEAGLRWSRLLAGRAVDGAALRAAFGPAGEVSLPPELVVDPADESAVHATATAFGAWWDSRYEGRAGAWQPERLAAPFRLSAATSTGPVTLVAPEHRGGRVDWHTFDAHRGDQRTTGAPASAAETWTALPTQVALPGMPALRWWQLENAAIDLGRIEAAPDDLGRLLLAEFALVYGGDFFVVPIPVPVGSLARVESLDVVTNFGETVSIPSAVIHDGSSPEGRRWRMYHCDTPALATAVGLFVPPTSVDSAVGKDLEDVLFARDEVANIAWAIERRVLGPWGAVVERREVEHSQRARAASQSGATNELRYFLSTTVPNSWLPLVPSGDSFVLADAAEPASHLLSGDGFKLESVELPRQGLHVTLHPCRARQADGTVIMWHTYRVRPGRGESSSGLRFDDLAHQQSI